MPGEPTKQPVDVVEVADRRRFEARAADGTVVGRADYERMGSVLAFTHTEVEPELEGQGIASALVAGALDQVRDSGRTVIAYCPYVRAWLRRHPDYQDLVAASPIGG
jgi:hypothetical protein